MAESQELYILNLVALICSIYHRQRNSQQISITSTQNASRDSPLSTGQRPSSSMQHVRLFRACFCWSLHTHPFLHPSSLLPHSPAITEFISQCYQSTCIFLCMHLDVLQFRPFSYAVCLSQNTLLIFIFHLTDIILFLMLSLGTFSGSLPWFPLPWLPVGVVPYISLCHNISHFAGIIQTRLWISTSRLLVPPWQRPSLVLHCA